MNVRNILYEDNNSLYITRHIDSDDDASVILSAFELTRELTPQEQLDAVGGVSDDIKYIGDEYTKINGVDIDTCTVSRNAPATKYHEWNGSEWVFNDVKAKDDYKPRMKAQKGSFVESGALVTVTVDTVDYTGCFHPTDSGLDSGAGASVYRESVDSTVPPVDFGDSWSCKDATGCYISIPMTEALLAKIGSYVRNWHVTCNRVYVERRDLMLAMTTEQLEAFDPEQDIIDNMPSRNIVIP